MRKQLIITGVIITILSWSLFGFFYTFQQKEIKKAKILLAYVKSEAGKKDTVPHLQKITQSLQNARVSFERIGTTQKEFNELEKIKINKNKKFSEDLLSLTSGL